MRLFPFLGVWTGEGSNGRRYFTDSDVKKESKDKTKMESPSRLLSREMRKIEENARKMQMNAMLCKMYDSCQGRGQNGHYGPKKG